MANGISAKLPLRTHPDDGIGLNKSYKDSIKQNIMNLLLTVPGERIMIPDFGVGIRTYLFENDRPGLRQEIVAKLQEQLNIFLPFINLLDVHFMSESDNDQMPPNVLSIRIEYSIVPLDSSDVLILEANELDNSISARPNDFTTII